MQIKKMNLKFLNAINAEGNKEQFTFRIDKSRNEYINVGPYWIRNFAKLSVNPVDINNLYEEDEIKTLIENEIANSKLNSPNLLEENFKFRNVLIISDGYGFEDHKEVLDGVGDDLCVICIRNAARYWQAYKFPDFLLVQNPFDNVFSQMPEKNYPKLIASRRAKTQFMISYKNISYLYDPVCELRYQSPYAKASKLFIDEYRNPICAAIGCAHHFGAKNIFMAYCSDAYKEQRPGAEEISEGLFAYPQQILANKIINANLFWQKFSDLSCQIYYTGVKNSFTFAKYLQKEDFKKTLIGQTYEGQTEILV